MITARLLLMPVLRSVELNVVDCAQGREGVEGEDGGGHEERRQPRTDFRMDVFDDLHTRCFFVFFLVSGLFRRITRPHLTERGKRRCMWYTKCNEVPARGKG